MDRRASFIAGGAVVALVTIAWVLQDASDRARTAAPGDAAPSSAEAARASARHSPDPLETGGSARTVLPTGPGVPDPAGDPLRGSILVRVRAAGDLAPAQAAVECLVFPWQGAEVEPARLSSTDAGGEVRFEVPPGEARLSAWAGGSTAGPWRCDVEAGREVVVELSLTPGAAVVGRVLDARTRMPISGASLWVSTFCDLDRRRSDERGAFVIDPFPVDERGHFVRCEASGYGSESVGLTVYRNETWRLEPAGRVKAVPLQARSSLEYGLPVRLDIELQPARTIVGRVVDATGVPIAEAVVRAIGHVWIGEGLARPDEGSALTDNDGRFELSPLRPDITHAVTASSEGRASARTFVTPGDATTVDVGPLRLEQPCELNVLVLAADGTPAESASVRLHFAPRAEAEGDAPVSDKRDFPRDADYELPIEERTTDAEGYARFESALAGVLRLDLRVDGKRVLWRDVEVSPGVPQTSVVLELPESRVTLRGRVLRDGSAVAQAEVHVQGIASRTVATGPGGVFVLAGNEPNLVHSVHATWTAPDGARWTSPVLDVAPAERPFVELTLAPPGS